MNRDSGDTERLPVEARPRRRRWVRPLLFFLGALASAALVAGISGYRFYRELIDLNRPPESSTGTRSVAETELEGSVVVAAHPEAVRMGRDMLDAGGTALDAAVAVQLALGLVEPQSSGIGGGAFLLYWDAASQQLHAYDGRERAPLSAGGNYFLGAEGKPLRFDRALIGGRSVGVPGVMRMLETAHRAHGRLTWSQLFDGPIALARAGFEVTPRLQKLISLDPILPTIPSMREYFLDAEGAPWPIGHRLDNPAYAKTLTSLQRDGSKALYEGPIARDIVSSVADAVQPSTIRIILNVLRRGLGLYPSGDANIPAPGSLTLDDLAAYRSVKRNPLCRVYRGHRVCAFGPPTSGGVAVLQILGLLQRFDIAALEPTSVEALHLFAEAQRLAYLDRSRWIGDPDAVIVPTDGLLDPAYLAERAKLIRRDRALPHAEAGEPPGADLSWKPSTSPERPSTSHFSIVDADGNVASMTTSIEAAFGSHIMVRGFLLNNQLTDFSFRPERDGREVANAPGPGKRPRSSMCPLIIFDADGTTPRFVVGSPGGRSIIAYVARTTVALIDWDLAPQQAVALPHVVAQGGVVQLERTGWSNDDERDHVAEALAGLGHDIDLAMHNSGLHVVEIDGRTLRPGVDPRREGHALSSLLPTTPAPRQPR